jgi:hypothetical protein
VSVAKLIRNPSDRDIVRLIDQSRFIASSDLYLLSDRSVQETSAALTALRRSKHAPVVGSIGRVAPTTFYPRKTYVYGSGRRGHLVHWLHVSHVRAVLVHAAHRLGVPLEWSQHRKHYRNVPDARVDVGERSWSLEVDNSTEGKSEGGIYGKPLGPRTLIVAFKSEERFRSLCDLPGLATWHGYWHSRETDRDWNILTAKVWWDGEAWVSLL